MIILLLTVALSGAAQDRVCALVPSDLLEQPRPMFSGLYKNESFGYSVVIPEPLKGYESAEATHHGFGLALGEVPQSYLDVEGRENSLDNRTAREAAHRFIRYLNKAPRRVSSTTIHRTKLGGLEAVETVVRYTCEGRTYVVASTLALGPTKDREFQVTLSSPSAQFAD